VSDHGPRCCPSDHGPERAEQDGCISDFVGPVGTGGAIVVIALILGFLGSDWLSDKDDARLDDLRKTAVSVCSERTESVKALRDCVDVTIEATGQKS